VPLEQVGSIGNQGSATNQQRTIVRNASAPRFPLTGQPKANSYGDIGLLQQQAMVPMLADSGVLSDGRRVKAFSVSPPRRAFQDGHEPTVAMAAVPERPSSSKEVQMYDSPVVRPASVQPADNKE
jgi:hypothetical protein